MSGARSPTKLDNYLDHFNIKEVALSNNTIIKFVYFMNSGTNENQELGNFKTTELLLLPFSSQGLLSLIISGGLQYPLGACLCCLTRASSYMKLPIGDLPVGTSIPT